MAAEGLHPAFDRSVCLDNRRPWAILRFCGNDSVDLSRFIPQCLHAATLKYLQKLYELIAPHLTEKPRRLLAGGGARALGRGGGAWMARISGLSRPTVYAGCGSWRSGPTLVAACAVGVVGPNGGPRPTRACVRRWTPWSTPTPAATPTVRCAGRASPLGSWPTR